MLISPALLKRLGPATPGPLRRCMAAATLRKAIIRTPKTKDGKVDYEAVPVGASIWVAVSDPSSPMYGRPIIITKRPDRKFALTGGSGWEHYKPGSDSAGNKDIERQRARKHQLVVGVGEKKRDVDPELAAKLAERRQAVAQAAQARRKTRDAASRGLLAAAGYDADRFTSDRDLERWRERTEAEAVAAGMRKADARAFTGLAVDEVQRLRKRAAMQKAEVKAVAATVAYKKKADDLDRDHVALIEAMPDPDDFVDRPLISGQDLAAMASDATPQEVEAAIKDRAATLWEQVSQEVRADAAPMAMLEQPQHEEAPPHGEPVHAAPGDTAQPAANDVPTAGQEAPPAAPRAAAGAEGDAPVPAAEPGSNADQPAAAAPGADAPPADDPERSARVERIKALAGAFADYHAASQDLKADSEAAAKLRSQFLMDAATVENLRTRVGAIDDADMDRLLAKYQESHQAHPPDAFYSALSPHWNDSISYADGIGQYASAGAATALTGLVGKHLGAGVDVGRLIGSSSIETGAMALAMKLRSDLSDQDFDRLIADVTRHNATNQQATEDRALALQKRLEAERAEIVRQRAAGELGGGEDGDAPDLTRLASGDLSPRAIAKYATSVRLEADNLLRQRENMGAALGSMQASAALLDALSRARAATRKKDQVVSLSFGDSLESAQEQLAALGLAGRGRIRHDIAKGYVVDIPGQSLRRHVATLQRESSFAAEMEAIKTDGSPTDGYQVPGWKQGTGYKWRTEQRNDIEWLRKTGGGVITRVTGAGKTNTALGFAAHQLAANPSYTGAIVVPKGKASEWHDEAQKFSTLPTVPIPDDAKRADVERLLRQHGRGKLYIMSHDQAARHADLLEGHDLDGITIDEPHMLGGKGKSKKMSAGAQRIMKLGSDKLKRGGTFHRVALTATPATSDPVSAFDLVNWVAPGKVGSRARFQRAYSAGFGAGTNAQEEAVQQQVAQHLGPYMSGERLTPPSFQTIHHQTTVQRTPAQIDRQKTIERGARAHIAQAVAERLQRAERDPLVQAKYGRSWKAQVAKEATIKAQAEIADQHRANLGGGDDNAKIAAALASVKEHGADKVTKHVFYVDSAAQRQALTAALQGAGYKQNQIANMAASTTTISGQELAARRTRFKTSEDVPFVIIDKASSAGHNLQEGSHLHVLGTPSDAATYLQAIGRVKREPRVGDVHIHTYRYGDSPFESADWSEIERQVKILNATAPGLTRG